MLYNCIPATELLRKLDSLPFTFQSTGSRHFGMAKLGSDYDFFVCEDFGLEETLFDLGFQKNCQEYPDDSCRYVYRHPEGVDVQIIKVSSYGNKNKANKFFEKHPYFLHTFNSVDKRINTELWNIVMEVFKSLETK